MLTLAVIEQAIRRSWGADTSDDPQAWSVSNPALGQCGVTALVVRELLGGDILIAEVFREGTPLGRHAWNRLPSGIEVDLTHEQFRAGERLGPPWVGEPPAASRAPGRAALLARRVWGALGPRREPAAGP